MNSIDAAASTAMSPDGATIFVTGYSYGSDTDYATVAYAAASGAERWVARYNGPSNSFDLATALAVSPDGATVFVTGYSHGSDTDYATVAYAAASGAELWVAHYDGPSNSDAATALAVSPDGATVFVTGESAGLGSNADYATVAYAAESGAQLWVVRYNSPTNSDDNATAVAVSPDGATVFVTGGSTVSGFDTDYATVAYATAGGAELWVARYNGPANSDDRATALAVGPDAATVFVTGRSYAPSFRGSDYATLAYAAASGAELWLARYNGPANSFDDATALAVSPEGATVFVTGASESPGYFNYDYATVAYSVASGAELWVARYNEPGNPSVSYDRANSIAVSPDGATVFVTGESGFGSSKDYATVAYGATSCANGRNEVGPLSGTIDSDVEPQSGSAAPFVHGVNCDVVAPTGL